MQSEPTAALRHRTVEAPAGRLHLADQGTGPLILLVHGFPESWYSWRRQLPALAAAGYRAAAIDVRGYGRSSKPAATDAYRMLDLVEDNVAVVRALGEESAVIVGHDWGSSIAAVSALLHPGVFRAVGLLSVPYAPPGGPRPPMSWARSAAPTRSSTSPTSRSPAAPRRRSSPTSGAGSQASTRLCPATPCLPRGSPTRTSSPAVAGCATVSPQARSRPG
ncbi:alpha/beta hydrolase [Streptomyces griseorubiginosus]|uniref:alpha/beta hydrolase n=1 Tax=Streptomyces griseorubiginosus TaxID=67304 RepID=UPI0033F34F46